MGGPVLKITLKLPYHIAQNQIVHKNIQTKWRHNSPPLEQLMQHIHNVVLWYKPRSSWILQTYTQITFGPHICGFKKTFVVLLHRRLCTQSKKYTHHTIPTQHKQTHIFLLLLNISLTCSLEGHTLFFCLFFHRKSRKSKLLIGFGSKNVAWQKHI